MFLFFLFICIYLVRQDISLANLVSCNVGSLLIAHSTGSKAGGARSNL